MTLWHNALIGCDIETWIFVLIAWSSGHVILDTGALFWAGDVFIPLIDMVIITQMWTLYPLKLLYIYWIKSFYVSLHFHLFDYINMYTRIESVTFGGKEIFHANKLMIYRDSWKMNQIYLIDHINIYINFLRIKKLCDIFINYFKHLSH